MATRFRLRTLLILLALMAVAWFAYREHWRIIRPGTWFTDQGRIIRPPVKPGIELTEQ